MTARNVITIAGQSYRIAERLGVTLGTRACIVIDSGGNRHAAVKEPGRSWRLWTAADKLQPRGTLIGQTAPPSAEGGGE